MIAAIRFIAFLNSFCPFFQIALRYTMSDREKETEILYSHQLNEHCSNSIKLQNPTSNSNHIFAQQYFSCVRDEQYKINNHQRERSCFSLTSINKYLPEPEGWRMLGETGFITFCSKYNNMITCSVHLSKTAQGLGACNCLDLDPLGNTPERNKAEFPRSLVAQLSKGNTLRQLLREKQLCSV